MGKQPISTERVAKREKLTSDIDPPLTIVNNILADAFV
jgi:hypothetical protein